MTSHPKGFDDDVVLVEQGDIDVELHTKGMDRSCTPDEQRAFESVATEQPAGSSSSRDGDFQGRENLAISHEPALDGLLRR